MFAAAAAAIAAASASVLAAGTTAGLAVGSTLGLTGAGLAAAGTAGATIAGAGALGAAGAGLGATGAAITGGDVGKGAMMGGIAGAVGGIAAPLAAAGAGAAGATGATAGALTGAASGAAGSAAGAAATGGDVGDAALMGGAAGGIMGGIGGTGKGVPTDGTSTTVGPSGQPYSGATPVNATDSSVVSGLAPDVTPLRADISINAQGLPVTPSPTTVATYPSGLNAVNTGGAVVSPTLTANSAPAPLNLKALPASGGLSPLMKGISAVAPGLVSGAIAGGGLDAPEPYVKPKSNYVGGASLSKDFKPYWADPQLYYAEGGAVDSMQTQQPMNKFAELGLQMAQQANQQAAQQLAPQAQQAQQAAPQGIAQAAPQASPAPATGIGYAKGGLLNDIPGSDKMFGKDKPDEVAKPPEQSDFMKQVQAGVQQQMQQQAAQPQPQPQPQQYQNPQNNIYSYANGGMTGDNLGGYSHGGIAGLTRGPGDGVSDSLLAQIGDSGKQPARLADGEFVVPSRAVSELGNGSTEAGGKRLQEMVNRIQAGRKKSIGKGKIAVDSKATKNLPA